MKSTIKSFAFSLGTFVLSAAASSASAATIVLNPVAIGTYTSGGTYINNSGPAGWSGGPNQVELRQFTWFNLAGVTGTLTSAALRFTASNINAFNTPDASEMFQVFDVSLPGATFANGFAGVAGFNDLGSGQNYGSLLVAGAAPVYDVALNATGLSYIQTNLGITASFGGAVTSLTKGQSFESLFNGTQRQLVLTTAENPVPLPGSLSLAVLGLIGLALKKRVYR